LARVDERLIHGQIINEWVVRINPTHILIIDEEMVKDEFMSNIYKALAPLWLDVQILAPGEAAVLLREHKKDSWRVLLLARTPQPFEALVRLGVPLGEVMLSDKVYLPNKLVVPTASKRSINWLLDRGVGVITQNFPTDHPQPVAPYKL